MVFYERASGARMHANYTTRPCLWLNTFGNLPSNGGNWRTRPKAPAPDLRQCLVCFGDKARLGGLCGATVKLNACKRGDAYMTSEWSYQPTFGSIFIRSRSPMPPKVRGMPSSPH